MRWLSTFSTPPDLQCYESGHEEPVPGAGRICRVHQLAWKVSRKDIEANGFNLDIKNPHKNEDDIGDPKTLLKEYKAISAQAQKTRDKLKRELQKALESTAR